MMFPAVVRKWLSICMVAISIIAVSSLVWAFASSRFESREERMIRRFEKIRRLVPLGELQSWATNLLSGGAQGRVRKVPEFVWRGHSESPPYAFIPYPGQPPAVWLVFSDASDVWFLSVGYTNFTL